MFAFDFQPRTRVTFGAGAIEKLGELARSLNFERTLLVADRGLVAAGHAALATGLLNSAAIDVVPYHDFGANPDTAMVEAGSEFARGAGCGSIVALGGGSSMDMAKAINLMRHSRGSIVDYLGYGRCDARLGPMIAIPTTAGTGSEAQSYAIISDERTHVKMAIGDPQLAFRAAILDPALTVSQPFETTAATGYDAISHAVESFVTTKRNAVSDAFAGEAWRLLSGNFERVLNAPDDLEARGAMLAGAHLAGAAIENSMLGATHACANPLTARFGIAHGAAIALMLPHVVAWNEMAAGERYRLLWAGPLSERLRALAGAARLPGRLADCGVRREDLPGLASAAAEQWTGRFNPRAFDARGALELYECAY